MRSSPQEAVDEPLRLPACLHCLAGQRSLMGGPLPGLDDEEGVRVPDDLPPVIDAHVHVFADPLFRAVWRWFDEHGWPIRYKLPAPAVLAFLLERGVEHAVALHYAHKPGIARSMNAFVAALVRDEPRVTGVATVFPGEPEAGAILDEGFAAGLRGVKLHCHVQCLPIDDRSLEEVWEACERHDVPAVVHAGREPNSPAYACDPYAICGADRVSRVLERHPHLKLVVPHLGADEFDEYRSLVMRHENLWLDTTMMLAGYFDVGDPLPVIQARPDRVLYGSDFPNLPYAWDRELARIARLGLKDADLERLLAENARELFCR